MNAQAKIDYLTDRRNIVVAEIYNYEIQLTSKNRKHRKAARMILEALNLELFTLNRKIRALQYKGRVRWIYRVLA